MPDSHRDHVHWSASPEELELEQNPLWWVPGDGEVDTCPMVGDDCGLEVMHCHVEDSDGSSQVFFTKEELDAAYPDGLPRRTRRRPGWIKVGGTVTSPFSSGGPIFDLPNNLVPNPSLKPGDIVSMNKNGVSTPMGIVTSVSGGSGIASVQVSGTTRTTEAEIAQLRRMMFGNS